MLQILKDIGLTEKEIQIFTTLYQEGELTIIEISKISGISRSYIYEALDNLMKKGFAIKVIMNNKTVWKNAPIERIMDHIDHIKEELDYRLKQMKRTEKKKELKINLYKGTRGIKLVCDEVLESKTRVIGWGAEGQLSRYLPHYYKRFKDICKERKLEADFIITKKMNRLAMVNVKAKKVPANFETNVEVNVHDNRTLIFFWKDTPEVIEIIDQNVADCFRNYHKIFWNNSK